MFERSMGRYKMTSDEQKRYRSAKKDYPSEWIPVHFDKIRGMVYELEEGVYFRCGDMEYVKKYW